MKIVHTGDWHIGKNLNQYSLIEDQKYYLNKLYNLLKEINADVLLICGDIFDRSVPSSEATQLLNDVFCKIIIDLKVKIITISGNHDGNIRLDFGSKLYKQSGLFIDAIPSNKINKITLKDNFGDINFYTIPYIEPITAKNILKDENIKTFNDVYIKIMQQNNFDYNQRNILLAHGFFSFLKKEKQQDLIFCESEINIGGADIVNANIFENFDYVALGHLHAPQKIGLDKIRYSGSILKYSVDEYKQQKKITIIEIKNKDDISISFKKIKPLRNVLKIEGFFDELLNNLEYTEDYIMLNLKDKQPIIDPISKIKNKLPNVLGIYYNKTNNDSSINISSNQIKNKTLTELIDEFYKYIENENLDEQQINILNEIKNMEEII